MTTTRSRKPAHRESNADAKPDTKPDTKANPERPPRAADLPVQRARWEDEGGSPDGVLGSTDSHEPRHRPGTRAEAEAEPDSREE